MQQAGGRCGLWNSDQNMIVFSFLKKVCFASKSSYSIQLAELLQTYCLATAMSDAQPSPETDVRVS